MKPLLLLLLALQIIASWSGAYADDMRPASLHIQQLNNNTFAATWKLPVRNQRKLSLTVNLDDNSINSSPISALINNNAYSESWQFTRNNGLQGLSIDIEGFEHNSADVLLRITKLDNEIISTVLNVDRPEFQVPATAAETSNTFITYLILGVEHILVGLDHLLFVACLVYLCNSLRKLLWTITGFTLAHSITLFLAASGIFTIPIPPVEAAIALSIVFLATEIAKQQPYSLTLRYPVLVSSSFGLLHGFGFASVLSDIGLPTDEKMAALVSFNIGVEIGQLLFISFLFIVFYGFRLLLQNIKQTTITVQTLRWPASYICGSVAMFWFIQRLNAF